MSYPELMLVMVVASSTKMPFRMYYFATAAKAMMLLSSTDEPITSCRIFRFGGLYLFCLFQLMFSFQIETKEQKIKIPMSFGVDHQVESTTEEEWNRQWHGMTVICLSVHSNFPIVKSKSNRKTMYSKVRQALSRYIPHADVLINHHLMTIQQGTLGLLPHWVIQECDIVGSSLPHSNGLPVSLELYPP
jgi:hypothetical protein